MAYNPSPEVRELGEIVKKRKRSIGVLITMDEEKIHMETYGVNKKLCGIAKGYGDIAWDAIYESLKD